jgi:hypothetical protein
LKLLSEDVLKEYGFVEKTHIPERNVIKILTRVNIDIVIREDGIYYSNMWIDYPLKDSAGLRKLYKELRREELNPI